PFIGGMLVTKFIASFMYLVMGVIVAAGVLNTILMAALQRTREIGTTRAVGAPRTSVLSVFISAGVFLVLFGSVPGAARGAAAIGVCSGIGIPAFSEAQRYSYGGDRLFPVLHIENVLVPPLIMLAVSVVAALAPSINAAGRKPAESLRYV